MRKKRSAPAAHDGALATLYTHDREAKFGSQFAREPEAIFLDGLKPGRFYALFVVEPGTETDLGASSVHVRRTDTTPLDIDEFFGRLKRAETLAAASESKLTQWYDRACNKCRSIVEQLAGVAGCEPTEPAKRTKKRRRR